MYRNGQRFLCYLFTRWIIGMPDIRLSAELGNCLPTQNCNYFSNVLYDYLLYYSKTYLTIILYCEICLQVNTVQSH